MLPRDVSVARSIDIEAPAEAVFTNLNSPPAWGATTVATTVWSPWMAKDPQQTVTFDGPDSGVCAGFADRGNPWLSLTKCKDCAHL